MRVLIAAAVAALLIAAPVLAQDAPAAPPAAQEPDTPEEIALDAQADAFQVRMELMGEEMAAVAADAAALDAVQARYQPEADAFAQVVVAFITARAAETADEAQKAGMMGAVAAVGPTITAIPAQVRAQVMAAAAAASAPQ